MTEEIVTEADATQTVASTGVDPSVSETVELDESNFTNEIIRTVSLAIAIGCSFFVFAMLNWADGRTWLIFSDNTPTGGDMGAHVFGPAYLRDNLLPNFQLSGWSPDWYAGFPAYQFYMVVPALAIVVVNAGLVWWIWLPLAVGVVAYVFYLMMQPFGKGNLVTPFLLSRGKVFWIVSAIVLIAFLHLPYGISFKIVSVAGVVSMPMSAWGMGRLARAPEPIPAMLSVATLFFLFDTNFTILGGNILSTMAGEFSYSISLSLALLTIGLIIRGMQDNVWRGRSAVILALVALCHVIPHFFIVPAVLLLVFVSPKVSRFWTLLAAVGLCLAAYSVGEQAPIYIKIIAVGVLCAALSSVLFNRVMLSRVVWLMMVGPAALALAMFWLLPFLVTGLFQGLFNDMGWVPLEEVKETLFTTPMKIAVTGAVLGAVVAFIKRETLGILFGFMAVFSALLIANLGEGALWNQRILPFFYLSCYLAAAVFVGFLIRFIGQSANQDFKRPDFRFVSALSLVGMGIAMIAIAFTLQILPFAEKRAAADGETIYKWLGIEGKEKNRARSWAKWNYTGYENKENYPEYRRVVLAMKEVGEQNGCGRALWETSEELDSYGTPMALMLLPFWTDGCIGSMEGLYFESSMTTPFHFLNQTVLSDDPSSAQRYLPYQSFDLDIGIAQLQTSGVRYYMAQSERAIAEAREHEDLTELNISVGDDPKLLDGPVVDDSLEGKAFVVFEVAGYQLVEGLDALPVVVAGKNFEDVVAEDTEAIEDKISSRAEELGYLSESARQDALEDYREELLVELEARSRFRTGWLGEATAFYNDPEAFPYLPAVDGPPDWPRTESLEDTSVEARTLPRADEELSKGLLVSVDDPAKVSDIKTSNNKISFSVDRSGLPVVVKTSYFTNWEVDGADGPYRVGPNQMVVVPTDTDVTLSYNRTWFDWLAIMISLTGAGFVFFFLRREKLLIN